MIKLLSNRGYTLYGLHYKTHSFITQKIILKFAKIILNKHTLLIYESIVYNIGMYSREFNKPPKNIVKNGKAKYGAYIGVPNKIDIRGMRAPYAGVPLPSFISNLRIKSRLAYIFSLDKYFGAAEFFDFKAIGIARLLLWNKETNKKNVYTTLMPPRRRFVPNDSTRGICACYTKSRFLKISWGNNHEHFSVNFDIKGDGARSTTSGYFVNTADDDKKVDLFYVNPSPTKARCSATWLSSMHTKGNLFIDNTMVDDSVGLGLMVMNRTYFKFKSKTTMICGMDKYKGRDITFFIKSSNMDAADEYNYNDNTLIVDGIATALPPVYITHPFGLDKKWIIQDTESMVDLSFTPASMNQQILDIIALRSNNNTLYGTFEGVLLTKDGEKILLKNFPGAIHKSLLRL